MINIYEIRPKCLLFFDPTEKTYKKYTEFGNNITDYNKYMKSVLQPGLRVKMLQDWQFKVKARDMVTVTSSVYVNKVGHCVLVDFDSGPRGYEVFCWLIEIVN